MGEIDADYGLESFLSGVGDVVDYIVDFDGSGLDRIGAEGKVVELLRIQKYENFAISHGTIEHPRRNVHVYVSGGISERLVTVLQSEGIDLYQKLPLFSRATSRFMPSG